MLITYDILVKFEGNGYISDYPQFDIDVDEVHGLTIEEHAIVCVRLLNHYCTQKQQMGELLRFGCEGMDLTEQVKEYLVPHT